VERVEVLRGPQGTLFGANSQGGAIRFITPTPSLTTRSYYGRASVTTTKHGDMGYEIGAAAGGPIVEDRIGFRFSAYHRREGGWIDHVSWQDPTLDEDNSNDVETSVIRAALTIKVNDSIVLTPSIYMQNAKYYDRDRTSMITRCPATLGSPVPSPLVPCPRGPSDPDNGKFNNYASVTQDASDHFSLPSLKASADWGNLNFVSVTSWLDRKVSEFNDATYFNDRTSFGNAYLYPVTPGFAQSINWQNPNIRQRSFTQEFRVSNANKESRLKWTVEIGRAHV
jgi:outer membrane receptor protein involved in Fe transport